MLCCQLNNKLCACCRVISTATHGISAAIRELEIYLKEYEIERQVWARRTPDVPYQAGRRTYLLLVGQAISDKHMTKLFQVVDAIHEANFLGLIVVDELQA